MRAYLERRYPDQVDQVLLNAVEVPASLVLSERVSGLTPPAFTRLTQHLIVPWVLFTDNSVVALDLTPLGADVNPLHSPTAIYSRADSQAIDRQLEAYRQAIPLDKGQPMKVVT